MTEAPDASEAVLDFVSAARDFCDFVERAASVASVSERLTRGRAVLARLVAEATALPSTEARPDKLLLWDGAPTDWPGFGSHDQYSDLADPYVDPYVDAGPVAGSLSDDFLGVYANLKRGLVSFDAGETQDAACAWRFHFDQDWGEPAVDALRVLHRACVAAAGDSASSEDGGPLLRVRTGGLVEETKITVGVYGPDVEPSAISARLGVQPTRQRRAGAPRKVGPPWREGAWLFTVSGEKPRGPEEVAEELLRALPPPEHAAWAELRTSHRIRVGVAVFLSGVNRGYALSEDVIRRLSALGGSVDFDI